MAGRYPAEPFDQVADSYDASVPSSTGWPHEGYEKMLDEVVTRADAHPSMTVLDLGVGTGNLTQRFLAIGCSVWGIDFSSKMLARAKPKLDETVDAFEQAGVQTEYAQVSSIGGVYVFRPGSPRASAH